MHEMAASSTGLLALLVLLATALFPSGSRAQGPPPSPSSGSPGASPPDCMRTPVEKLSPCLPYVEAGSNKTRPDHECCKGLAVIVEGEPTCLCSLLSASGDEYGVKVDLARALMLPSACRVKTPPLSLCPALSPSAGGRGTAPTPTSGDGVDPGFTSPGAALALLAGLAFAAVGIL